MPRLADRLTQQREESFVGRTAQLELLSSALLGDATAAPIWYIHGAAGIGKSALLSAVARRCAARDIPVWFVDARHAEPSREGLLALFREALGIETHQAPLAALGAKPGRQVLIIDSFERLAPLTAWLSEVVLPELPEQVRVILAGRNHPPLDWQVDPGWRTVVRLMVLSPLTPDESRMLLARRQIASAHHDALVALARGHPLTLALAADLVAHHGTLPLSREPSPETITAVLERFIQATPSAAHRMALEVCALVRSTTEGLLGALLELPDCYELFEWLRGLACIEAGPHGLFPNDLVREALIADLRWRNRERYMTLHQRARSYYGELLRRTSPAEQQPILAITRNQAINTLRSRRERSRGRELNLSAHHEVAELASEDPIDLVLLRAAVRAALVELPAAQRQAIEQMYFDGLSSIEIAARQDVPLGTVKTRLRLGMLKLHTRLRAWVTNTD